MSVKLSELSALVTAGSTVGRLDAVRYTEQLSFTSGASEAERRFMLDSQNPFKGALGLRIAEALHRKGMKVTLLTRADLLRGERCELPQSCIESFFTFEELEKRLPELLGARPDLMFMAAAVSDYVPVSIHGVSDANRDGKIASDADSLTVTFRKTPKLIDRIRAQVGLDTTIVGFKLLVGVSTDVLREAAVKQLKRARTDLCFANDFRELSRANDSHPGWLCHRSGHMRRIEGTKAATAEQLVDETIGYHLDALAFGRAYGTGKTDE